MNMAKLNFSILLVYTYIVLICQVQSLHLIMSQQKPQTKVVITGAGNSVGMIVFKKLLKRKSYYPIGLVNDKKAYNSLINLGADPEQVKICDICDKQSLVGLFDGATKAVLCASSKPMRSLKYKLKSFLRKVTFRQQKNPTGTDLYYPDKLSPYQIDYLGNRNILLNHYKVIHMNRIILSY